MDEKPARSRHRHHDPSPAGMVPALRELSVVTVLYNSAADIEACLTALPAEVHPIVVDNASSDDGSERARAVRPDATVIRSPRNLGFGGGCNVGWRASERPYVAFVNPDVRVEPDTLGLLLRRAAEQPHSMVGPALVDAAGGLRPCKRRPTARLDVLGLMPAASRWAPAGWDAKVDPGEVVQATGGVVDSVEGACFVMARADLEAIGGFDEDMFLYYEEESLALRLSALGGQAIYEPAAHAAHVGGTSTAQVSGLAIRHLYRSRILFYRKRDGGWRGRLWAVAHGLAILLAFPGSVLNALLGRRRLFTPAYQLNALRGLAAGSAASVDGTVKYPPDRAGG
jgi:N-acetylglucosaminyl-diphospho-decaprenol L-rhamnosyltransferase